MNLLEDAGADCWAHSKASYWREVVRARGELIEEIAGRLEARQATPEVSRVYPQARTALSAAQRVHELLSPGRHRSVHR
jgi:NADPH:quinone reductase-like Zn-dependent oxidoreductase